jgi:predicted transcriptional regulator
MKTKVTKVKELMRAQPVIVAADATLKEAAQKMKSVDCGVLPVGSWDRLEGIITDRDIVIRAVADGIDPATATVRSCMTSEIFYCNDSDTLEQAAEKMREHDVSRLVVKDSSGKPCGIITFGCIMRKGEMQELGKVVERAVGKRAA